MKPTTPEHSTTRTRERLGPASRVDGLDLLFSRTVFSMCRPVPASTTWHLSDNDTTQRARPVRTRTAYGRNGTRTRVLGRTLVPEKGRQGDRVGTWKEERTDLPSVCRRTRDLGSTRRVEGPGVRDRLTSEVSVRTTTHLGQLSRSISIYHKGKDDVKTTRHWVRWYIYLLPRCITQKESDCHTSYLW